MNHIIKKITLVLLLANITVWTDAKHIVVDSSFLADTCIYVDIDSAIIDCKIDSCKTKIQKRLPNAKYFIVGNHSGYVSDDGILINKERSAIILVPANMDFPSGKYVCKKNISELTDCAFYNVRNLKSIDMHNKVSSVGKAVFFKCSALSDVVFHKKMKYIGSNAFGLCIGLKQIKIKSVDTIALAAFNRCENLEDINIYGKVKLIDDMCFIDCQKLKRIILPKAEYGMYVFGYPDSKLEKLEYVCMLGNPTYAPRKYTNPQYFALFNYVSSSAILYVKKGYAGIYKDTDEYGWCSHWKQFKEIREYNVFSEKVFLRR
jgi:hypothetical protein